MASWGGPERRRWSGSGVCRWLLRMENDDGQAGGKFCGVLGSVDAVPLPCWFVGWQGVGSAAQRKKVRGDGGPPTQSSGCPLLRVDSGSSWFSRVPGLPSGEACAVSRAMRATVDRRTTQRAEELRCLSNDRPLGPELALTTGPWGDGDPRRSSASSLGDC